MEDFFTIVFRTVLFYFLVLVVFRLMGKREIGELSVLDLLIFMMIAEVVAICIDDINRSIWDAIIPMTVLGILQVSLSYISLRSQRFRLLMDGAPSIIIANGKVNEKVMHKLRYNYDDLMVQIREGGVGDIRDVDFAILESSGKLSVFKKKGVTQSKFAYPLILDGLIQVENLNMINQTKEWLIANLSKLGYKDPSKIGYCSYRNGRFFVDIEDEEEGSE
ncbi:MAG: DUF421 domain-containing protein [Bacillaceae bacterium]